MFRSVTATRCRLAACVRALGPIAGGLALVLLLAARAAPEAAEALVLPGPCPKASAKTAFDALAAPRSAPGEPSLGQPGARP